MPDVYSIYDIVHPPSSDISSEILLITPHRQSVVH